MSRATARIWGAASSARRPGAAASWLVAARMSSSVALPIRSVYCAVKSRPSWCTNRWREPVRSTSKSVRSATTSGRAVMVFSLRRAAPAPGAAARPGGCR
jgi:hypothetical protein